MTGEWKKRQKWRTHLINVVQEDRDKEWGGVCNKSREGREDGGRKR